MNMYTVRFPDYTLMHSTTETHFNYFEFNSKKYPIGAYVKLNKNGMGKMYYNNKYYYKKGNFRLVDYYIDSHKEYKWDYIIGWTEGGMPVMYSTKLPPEEFISEVIGPHIDETVYTPGVLKIEFKEPNYYPKDWNVDGVMSRWGIFIIVMIGASVFNDWWIEWLIRVVACFYFGHWRENKINEAIRKQKFKE